MSVLTENELHAEYWNNKAKQALHTAMSAQRNSNKAKNVILFLGDGESEKGAFTQFKYFL